MLISNVIRNLWHIIPIIIMLQVCYGCSKYYTDAFVLEENTGDFYNCEWQEVNSDLENWKLYLLARSLCHAPNREAYNEGLFYFRIMYKYASLDSSNVIAIDSIQTDSLRIIFLPTNEQQVVPLRFIEQNSSTFKKVFSSVNPMYIPFENDSIRVIFGAEMYVSGRSECTSKSYDIHLTRYKKSSWGFRPGSFK